MAKVTRPLFGDAATGPIADLLTFGKNGSARYATVQGQNPRIRTEQQKLYNNYYGEAHKEWMKIPKQMYQAGNNWYFMRMPPWRVFYLEWLREHQR